LAVASADMHASMMHSTLFLGMKSQDRLESIEVIKLVKKTKITIDHSKCHSGASTDPRDCRRCLYVCDPAVLLLHPTLEDHPDPHNPEIWRIDAIWLSKCTGCMKCVKECPEQSIMVEPGVTLHEMKAR